MSELRIASRRFGFESFTCGAAVASLLTFAACGHRAPPGGDGDGSGNTAGTNGGGLVPGSGTGGSGNPPVPGAGSPSTSGGTNPGGGAPPVGTGGTAGSGEVVVVPGAGMGGGAPVNPPMKMACADSAAVPTFYKPYTDMTFQTQAKQMATAMTPAQLAEQMRGTSPNNGQNFSDIFRTPDSGEIKGFLFRDGPRGVNLAAQLPAGQRGYATVFPVPISRGASFDLDLEYRIGVALGDETLGSGNTLQLAPTVNILRHPAWGRSQETYGEDVYHLGRMGTASVVGMQEFVPACVKHYAANNIENNRENMNAQMDAQTLREMYARHFEMIIKDSGVACVMASYNPVNGAKATQNKVLLNDILRTDFGFRGFVLTDWWAMPPGQKSDAGAETYRANAIEAVQAGLDMELPWSLNFQHLEAAVMSGALQRAALETAAARILEQKLRFKMERMGAAGGLKRPTTSRDGQGSITNNTAHIELAYEAALKGTVLLKNENNTLPIKRDTMKTIAVIGAQVSYEVTNTDQATGSINFATDVRTGDLGSSRAFADPAKSIGPFAGIQAAAGAGVTVVSGNTAAAAANADFIVVVAGLTPEDEGEEYTQAGDRANTAGQPNLQLDPKNGDNKQNQLIAEVAALKKPMVVVLQGGAVIEMPWLADVPAVVMAWYPGMVGGRAIGELLFGAKNFSGKLPITWSAVADFPPFRDSGAATKMDYDLGYRHFDRKNITPLYPFGHGLSYTKFEYSNLAVPCSTVTKNGVVEVKVNVSNTGMVAGDETAMLFVSYPMSAARRPVRELKGFYRVSLEAGQTKQITIPLRIADLKYWDMTSNSWVVESGPVQIQVGPNARTLPLMDTVTVN